MDMQKEQKEVDKMCEDLVDMHIEDLLKGKNDAVGISAALRSDLTRDNPELDAKWEEVYRRQPSCKDIADATRYNDAMREKYVRVYKICKGIIDE
jgi:hypothetical protein